MAYVQMKNRDGNYVEPSDVTFKAAAANAQWDKAPGFYEILTNEPGKDSWPITGATFILVYKNQDNAESAKEAEYWLFPYNVTCCAPERFACNFNRIPLNASAPRAWG